VKVAQEFVAAKIEFLMQQTMIKQSSVL